MTRRTLVVTALLLALAPAAPAAPPEVPAQISYQGVLLDTLGEPRTGNVDLTLRIWDAPTGGTLVYKQVFPSVALAAGVFTVRLGPTGAASDTPDDPLTTSLADYLLVSAPEMPPVDIIHQESPTPLNPLGVKGVGECGVVPVPAAIMSAIEDALTPLGVHVAQAPLFPQELCALIEEARDAKQPGKG